MKTWVTLVVLSCLYSVVGCGKSNEEPKAQVKEEAKEKENLYIGIGIMCQEIIVKTNTYVVYVFPNTPAAKTDLRAGDQILKVNGVDVQGLKDLKDLHYLLASLPPKTVIELIIMRDGEKLTISTYTDIIKR